MADLPMMAMARDEAFANAVWEALKGDHNDLRKQAIILRAHRAALKPAERDNNVVDSPAAEVEKLVAKAAGVLPFFRSVIQCGESWSETCERDYRQASEAMQTLATELTRIQAENESLRDDIARLREALGPFAAMGRVMDRRATLTFGRSVKDSEIVCESSGEAGMGILVMGHFRDAVALLPNAPGWEGMYRPPFDRATLNGGSDA